MPRRLSALITGLLLAQLAVAADLPSPESFLGHPVGADRRLAPYPKVLEYLRLVADASDRVSIEEIGRSTLDNEMVVVVLTSESNQLNLERYREIARQLANPDELSVEEAGLLVDEGKAIALVTCTIHSTEVGSTQMSMEFVHDFATTEDPDKLAWMEEVILLLMPSLNPDGQIMVVDWYNEYLDTEYEGGRMPWLYHHYVGHDNNRDFYMLTQKETQVANQVLYHRWFPQVFLDEHQMGSTGARMFVPPQTDPLALEIPSLIFRQADLLGTNMSYRLEEDGRQGVGHNMIFDSYWPGGTRNTAWWKNVTGLLTEVASARLASPIYIDPGELRGGGKGLPEYKRRANFPSPWEGGWWRLRDIVDYELVATWALTETMARYREEFLQNFYSMGRESIEAGRTEAPYAWILPPDQHDPVAAGRMVELLLEHGVRVFESNQPLRVGHATYPPGTQVIPADQPYRPFLLTMLRPQRYPEILPYVGGPILEPYDVTAWSLPLLMGVDVIEANTLPVGLTNPIDAPVWPSTEVTDAPGGWVLPHSADSVFTAMSRLLAAGNKVYWLDGETGDREPGDVYLPAGEISRDELQALAAELHLPVEGLASEPVGPAYQVAPTRVGLFKPWVASMDEGWTRWLLERYEIPFINLNNEDIKESSFAGQADVLLFPDVSKNIIEKGEPDPEWRRWWTPLPPEYSGGIEPDGGEHIKTWVENGGTVVALDSSTAYFIELFDLPVTDVLEEVDDKSFSAPGSLLRLEIDTSNPLGFGMRPVEAGYFANSPAFRTKVPDPRFDRWVVARYPDHRDDIPVSGYIKGTDLLIKRAAVVEVKVGEGRVVLIGFRAQHRAQPHRTFKLLFNALYLPGLTETTLGEDGS
jgi:hypothetical protein